MAVARKWRQNIWENFENLESLDGLKWQFQSFLSQDPTHKRQNISLVHQKYADFVGFSWKCADRNSAKISARGTRSPRRPNFTVWSEYLPVFLIYFSLWTLIPYIIVDCYISMRFRSSNFIPHSRPEVKLKRPAFLLKKVLKRFRCLIKGLYNHIQYSYRFVGSVLLYK
jgi:hypothetical protein